MLPDIQTLSVLPPAKETFSYPSIQQLSISSDQKLSYLKAKFGSVPSFAKKATSIPFSVLKKFVWIEIPHKD